VRNWLLVVALVVGLLIELVWPQSPSANMDALDPGRVIQDATGGAPALTLTSTAAADFFQGPNALPEAGVKDGRWSAVTDAANRSLTYASRIFGYALDMDGHQTGKSLRGEVLVSSNRSRQDERDRDADSGPSAIHH
jgi:hypothetical protein